MASQDQGILIENSGYHLRNLGDVAMLQGAIARIRRCSPSAELHVINSDEERLHELIPGAVSVSHHLPFAARIGRISPIPHRVLPGKLRDRAIQRDLLNRILHSENRVKCATKLRGTVEGDWLELLSGMDVVIATGGGYLTDPFKQHAMGILNTLSLAQAMGKPTALFGQGIGPIGDRGLKMACSHVIGRASVLALRESVTGPETLSQISLPPRVHPIITGDDALELIPERVAPSARNCIGVTVRCASYSGLDEDRMRVLKNALTDLQKAQPSTVFCPLPIDQLRQGHDDESHALNLLEGCKISPDYETPKVPKDVIDLASTCSVTITGSYHSALFSIAQGVPVIALQASRYYKGKFAGLLEMFPDSVSAFSISDIGEGKLEPMLQKALNTPDDLRGKWVKIASKYKTIGNDFYQLQLQQL